ncbi:MAG: VanZ family protein [Dorea sp.]|nr:VanZ family protein [Dorea sp.]
MLLMTIIPIILTLGPVIIYQAVQFLWGRRTTAFHCIWTYIMMLYIRLVFSVAGIGSIWDIFAKGGAATLREAHISLIPFQSAGLFTYCMNIIMFMPLGFLLPYIWKNYRNPLKTALTGLLLSALIEAAQLPTSRLADIDDLMMNTLGAVLGYMVWRAVGRHFFNRKEDQRTISLGNSEPVIYIVSACVCTFLLYSWKWFI